MNGFTSTSSVQSKDLEFEFTQADFSRVCALIYQRAGISLNSGKQAMVYSRLSRRLRESGYPSFQRYLSWLENTHDPKAEEEWQHFINALTTNLTSFFRESHHFDMLASIFKKWSSPSCRIWCSAASTGEEPYSLAMTAAESLDSRVQIQILASDIDTQVLATAKHGIYDAHARGLSPERLKLHFLRGTGPNAGSIRIKPELRQMIDFQPFNLMSAHWDVGDPFDIVFCRNVMIYFDHDTQRQVLKNIHCVIKPQGMLFVGHSENFSDAKTLFALQGKTAYRRL
jgi:chemotaxis protein methyltransferase CheR